MTAQTLTAPSGLDRTHIVHHCALCDRFSVAEPRPELVTEWREDGSIHARVRRYGWELTVVQHLAEEHPDRFAEMFAGVSVGEALLQTAQRVQDSLTATLTRALSGVGR